MPKKKSAAGACADLSVEDLDGVIAELEAAIEPLQARLSAAKATRLPFAATPE